ncbi:MAG: translation initiation factor IF-2 subunit alpha [Candidatus Diapherotrites archaeon]|nr:translation initiation factor IF-2 subunit alpha [Candidatus Diapherotrites archaeon]
MSGYPTEGELVIVNVTKVKPYGAFATLSEYDAKEGFVHISEVSTSWVKNIRNFVKPGTTRVAKVIGVDIAKGQIDLSLKRVSEGDVRKKMDSHRRTIRSKGLFEFMIKNSTQDLSEIKEKVKNPLDDEFGDLYSAFEYSALNGADSLTDIVGSEWSKIIFETAEKSITISKVSIGGHLILTSEASDGVEKIKQALSVIDGVDFGEDVDVELTYISAPKYKIDIMALDYKTAEKALKQATELVINKMVELSGAASFERQEKD